MFRFYFYGDRDVKELSPGIVGCPCGHCQSPGLHFLTFLLLLSSLQSVTTLHPAAFPKVPEDLHVFKSKRYFLILISHDFFQHYVTLKHSLFLKWFLSLASKTTHSLYFFPTSPDPVYQSPLEVHLPLSVHYTWGFLMGCNVQPSVHIFSLGICIGASWLQLLLTISEVPVSSTPIYPLPTSDFCLAVSEAFHTHLLTQTHNLPPNLVLSSCSHLSEPYVWLDKSET